MNVINEALKVGAKIVFSGEKVEPEEQKRRLTICESCEKFDAVNRKCTVCGCFMDVKTMLKTNRTLEGKMVDTKCPEGKW